MFFIFSVLHAANIRDINEDEMTFSLTNEVIFKFKNPTNFLRVKHRLGESVTIFDQNGIVIGSNYHFNLVPIGDLEIVHFPVSGQDIYHIIDYQPVSWWDALFHGKTDAFVLDDGSAWDVINIQNAKQKHSNVGKIQDVMRKWSRSDPIMISFRYVSYWSATRSGIYTYIILLNLRTQEIASAQKLEN